jgi:hypothetical protein
MTSNSPVVASQLRTAACNKGNPIPITSVAISHPWVAPCVTEMVPDLIDGRKEESHGRCRSGAGII